MSNDMILIGQIHPPVNFLHAKTNGPGCRASNICTAGKLLSDQQLVQFFRPDRESEPIERHHGGEILLSTDLALLSTQRSDILRKTGQGPGTAAV